jgi:hypothetical protein
VPHEAHRFASAYDRAAPPLGVSALATSTGVHALAENYKEKTMKSPKLKRIIALGLFATIAIPAQLAAQHTHYKLVDMGTLGGPASYLTEPGNGRMQHPLRREHPHISSNHAVQPER